MDCPRGPSESSHPVQGSQRPAFDPIRRPSGHWTKAVVAAVDFRSVSRRPFSRATAGLPTYSPKSGEFKKAFKRSLPFSRTNEGAMNIIHGCSEFKLNWAVATASTC